MNALQIGDITIPIPIVQGGMGIGISMSKLASAVANAGGIGTIASVGLGLVYNNPKKSYRENNVQALKNEIKKARALTSGVLGVNIMSVLTNFGDLVKAAIEENIDIIFSGAGLPLDLPQYLTNNKKTKLVPIVSSGRAAKILAQKWWNNFNYLPDAFVVEGPKAGGHLGFKKESLQHELVSLDVLVGEVKQVADSLFQQHQKHIPIIAGGGIMTGKDIYHIFEKGASAVQMGSRFIATDECDASIGFKQTILNTTQEGIKIIDSPVGMPGRAVNNAFLQAADNGQRKPTSCKYHCIKSCNPKTTKYCIADALLNAYLGEFQKGFAFAGANAYKINAITNVSGLMSELIADFNLYQKKMLLL